MTEGEFLARMDRHIERMDGHVERMDGHVAVANRHMARGNELMERVEEEMRLNREERAETREFMRELTVRNERVTQELVARIGEDRAILQGIHAEQVAFRRSLFRVHDKLEDLRPEDLG